MVNTNRHIIRILSLLLLLCGTVNQAWATKVTYHILTKPFTVKNHDGNGNFHTNIRVEALQCTSEEATVGLPDQFKSPLATGFRYWATATRTYEKLYDSRNNNKIITTKYYIYNCSGGDYDCLSNEILDPEHTSSDAYTDIYVTYDYNSSNGIIDLNGGTSYNIAFTNGGNEKYVCFNRSRNNRIASALGSGLTGEQLASDDFVIPENGSGQLGWYWSKWGPQGILIRFKFTGEDPYNITIMTSYEGKELHITDAITNVDGNGTIKPYKGSVLMSKVGANSMWFDVSNNKHYKISSGIKDYSLWTPEKYAACWDAYYNAASDAVRYDSWDGFYRSESPTLNAFAFLNHPKSGYMFVGSKMNQGDGNSSSPTINQPNSKGEYYTYYDYYDNDNGKRRSQPYFKLQSLSSALSFNFNVVKTYTFHVKTHGATGETPSTLTATEKWSDAELDEAIVDHIPDVIRRKYVTYKAYSDAGLENDITTFAQATSDEIWLDYTVSENLPFKTLPAGGNYQNAQWYTMRMDGVANPKFIAYKEDDSNDLIVTDGDGNAKGSNTASELHQGEDSPEAMVAFMGDPYELKILSRKACESAGANTFIGRPAASAVETNLTTNNGTSDISTWEIVYESTGETGILLRQFKTANDYANDPVNNPKPRFIGLGVDANNKPVTYSETESRIRVVELEKVKYTYYIVRNNEGDIAVKASATHDVGKALKSWTDIPDVIRSPFLKDATVKYYGSLDDAKGNTNAILNAPYNGNRDIYVRYSLTISGSTYNVRLNNDYIYTGDGDIIYNKPLLDDGDKDKGAFQWVLDYSDPYHMTIRNSGKGKYVNVDFSDAASITWSDTPSYFVAKSGAIAGTYEVMAATGSGTDASETYYNIGRPSANTVMLYSNSSYQYGNAVLRFQLIGTDATRITYHLIDKKGKDLLQATTRQITTEAPSFPPEYHSPLVSTYHYYAESSFNKDGDTYTLQPAATELASVGGNANIYVTYDVNDLVNLKAGQLYLLKYEAGEEFRQEDGVDGLLPAKTPEEIAAMTEEEKAAYIKTYKAVYPYVNGDGNFFVYGQEQYELQQEGASSTRTRWAWYVESNVEGAPKGDPYHVTIKSRQTESYPITNSSEYNAYFMTYKPDGYSEVVTTLGWPGMNSETATEYMILGSEGQYQLVTSNLIGGSRYVVNSFEQYWKTYDTIRRKLLGQSKADYPDNDNDPILVQSTPCLVEGFDNNRTYLTTSTEAATPGLGFHSYEKWAYAKRWNGFNNGYSSTEGTHETKKGWEKIEHWYQTVDMGEGYFDFVKTNIDPVLILLDQHGWEIMRKPIPTDPEDPQKDAKYAEIRPYNSPMVKEYAYWATAKKRTGFHQYYLLSDRIGGDDYVSTDLTSLPPYGSKNVKDKKGNLNDQYVTYIVKDEYAQTYTPSTKTGKEFLIEQGSKYASTSDGTTITKNDVSSVGSMQKHVTNDAITAEEKWYVKPNWNIDYEMGYGEAAHNWDAKTPNAYEDDNYKDNKTAVYIDQTDEYKNADATGKKAIKDKYGFFSFSNGFDPYNIQISSVSASAKFMKTNANGTTLDEGSFIGSYPAVPGTITMGDNTTIIDPKPKWYDSRNLSVTNATYMAVQDAAGNMQLMPRFDHITRMGEFGTLIAPTDDDVAKTYTKLYRPEVYEYLIIDNDGKESLRYKSGGDLTPQTPNHFKSPLATDFKYYKNLTLTDGVYTEVKNKSDISEKEITASLDGATLTDNKVYVRYEYDEEADGLNMLKGNWLTMQLNEKDAIYDSGIKKANEDKPATIDATKKTWQWKFAHNSQPDPYAFYIYNRSQSPAGTKATADRFALLSHTSGDYALAKAGEGIYTYSFLNGNEMTTSTSASVAVESSFTPTSGTFDGTKSQVKLANDVTHTFTYKVYTNGGVEAISADQSQEDVINNDWKPVLPVAARTPLLNLDQYRYYELSLAGAVAENDTLDKALFYLFGLYDDIIYTHYTPYNAGVSSYLVPNVRNATNVNPVARGVGSNDAQIGLDGKRPYNIVWYDDYIMKSDGTSITKETDQELQASPAYEWEFEGDDPYAIKIKSVGASVGETKNYIHESNTPNTTELSTTPTTFMLLNKENYTYGVFAKTGDATTMLSGYGNELTTSNTPTKFIPFALSTFKVIYHLMIKNIGEDVIIPYKGPETGNVLNENYIITTGTTLRDLESQIAGVPGDKYQLGVSLKSIQTQSTGLFSRDIIYCHDAGHVSLGDAFEVPQVFYRPNVSYDYYIEGVYSADGKTPNDDMNTEYKGLKMTNLGDNNGLLGNIVFVNIVYNFLGGLETNAGTGFVTNVNQNKWYTFETSDATPQLTQYTTLEGLKTKSGYATHYTNDYLWTPVGDPYGFKMYNRYIHKNRGENKVMSTSDITTDRAVEMVADDNSKPHLPANSVYELLANNLTTPGYFRVHPVANMHDLTQFYIKNDNGNMKLNPTPTEWRFGLSEDLMKPYYQGAGYVGGLNPAGKSAYEEVCGNYDNGSITEFTKLINLQDVVYNHDTDDENNYIVHYAPGYYRLHSQPGSESISTPRYLSGYTHKIERDLDGNGDESDAIPMHFYEVEQYDVNNPTFKDLGTAGTDYTESAATRGDIPLVTVDKDPASIFYFAGAAAANPSSTMQTQGLYVKENKMTATAGNATSFNITDIGGAIVILHNGSPANYLSYDQSSAKYDIKYGSAVPARTARWCMKPVQKRDDGADNGEMALKVTTNNGGDEYYYTTFYAPFDVLLTTENDIAYIVPTGQWNYENIHPKKIGEYNTEANNCPEAYRGNNQFIPAGTPVIIRTKNTGGEVTMALPTTSPSSALSCVFSGQYLEQMLTQSSSDYVFVLGRSYTHSDDFTYNEGSGVVTPAGLEFDKGVGFYINASNNRESSATKTMWTRNNKYVYANKIYYRGAIPAPSPVPAMAPEFVPVIFDDEEGSEELNPDGSREVIGDGCVYDLMGRKVATREQVEDGSWKQRVATGIYIINGKKIRR